MEWKKPKNHPLQTHLEIENHEQKKKIGRITKKYIHNIRLRKKSAKKLQTTIRKHLQNKKIKEKSKDNYYYLRIKNLSGEIVLERFYSQNDKPITVLDLFSKLNFDINNDYLTDSNGQITNDTLVNWKANKNNLLVLTHLQIFNCFNRNYAFVLFYSDTGFSLIYEDYSTWFNDYNKAINYITREAKYNKDVQNEYFGQYLLNYKLYVYYFPKKINGQYENFHLKEICSLNPTNDNIDEFLEKNISPPKLNGILSQNEYYYGWLKLHDESEIVTENPPDQNEYFEESSIIRIYPL